MYIINKTRKIVETGIISNHNTIKQKNVFFFFCFKFVSLFGQIGTEKLKITYLNNWAISFTYW